MIITSHLKRVSALVLVLAGVVGEIGAWAGPLDGAVLAAYKLVDHGPETHRFNFVFLAEGFQTNELAKFAINAQAFVTTFFNTTPFNTNRTCFNFWCVEVASVESGADNPATCADGTTAQPTAPRTYFDAKFCSSGIRRLLTVNSSTALGVLNTHVPGWDAALVIVNATNYGGSGGSPAVTSLAGSWRNISLHEFGHSGFGLGDEYDYWAGCTTDPPGSRDYHSAAEPSNPNVTVENRADFVKWRDLFYPGIDIPTTVSSDCTKCNSSADPFPGETRVGLYEGAHYYHCAAYRPAFSCMMRNYAAFCGVCSARILQVLQPFQPGNYPPLVMSGNKSGSIFKAQVPSSMGKAYQLEFRDTLEPGPWDGLAQTPGTGAMLTLTDSAATNVHRFYRVRQW